MRTQVCEGVVVVVITLPASGTTVRLHVCMYARTCVYVCPLSLSFFFTASVWPRPPLILAAKKSI